MTSQLELKAIKYTNEQNMSSSGQDQKQALSVPAAPLSAKARAASRRKLRFKELTDHFGWTVADLGHAVDAQRQTSANWADLGSSPGDRFLDRFEKRYRVMRAWITHGVGPMIGPKDQEDEYGTLRESSAKSTPVLSGQKCAYTIPLLTVEEAACYPNIEYVQTTWPTVHEVAEGSFALMVSDDTMQNSGGVPTIPEGYVVTVNVSLKKSAGAIMVVKCPGALPSIRKLVETPEGTFLKPLNTTYPAIKEPEGTEYIGRIVNSEFLF